MRIVLTGGPGAGKTVIAQQLALAEPHRFALVPEAATQVYFNLQTRWDRLDLEGRRDVQRRIYHHQREQEVRISAESPTKIVLLDRGTIDGAAYWPEGSAAYWTDLQSTLVDELRRYDAVIWLETAATLGVYDGDVSNACRFEDPAAAIASGKLLLQLWGSHPHLHHVGAFSTLQDKVTAVKEVINGLTDKTSSIYA